jgi:prepilin-type N-terminal cleavage/methylation domain-containing protein
MARGSVTDRVACGISGSDIARRIAAFTLIELLVVIAIIAVLIGLLLQGNYSDENLKKWKIDAAGKLTRFHKGGGHWLALDEQRDSVAPLSVKKTWPFSSTTMPELGWAEATPVTMAHNTRTLAVSTKPAWSMIASTPPLDERLMIHFRFSAVPFVDTTPRGGRESALFPEPDVPNRRPL